LKRFTAGGELPNQLVAASPGALPGLVQLLGSSNREVQAAAAAAVANLAAGNAGFEQQLAAAPGAVQRLVQLLVSKHHDVQVNAECALQALAADSPPNSAGCAVIAAELVQLVGSSKGDDCETAVAALARLVQGSQVLSQKVAAAPGALQGLVQLLSSNGLEAQAAAAAVIKRLAESNYPVIKKVAAMPGAVERLVQLLCSKQCMVRCNAEHALRALAANSPHSSSAIAAELVKLLGSSKDVECGAAVAANVLAGLVHARNVLSEQVTTAPGAVQGLVQMLGSSNHKAQAAAAQALQHLAAGSRVSAQQLAASPGAVPGLVQMLSSSSDKVQAAAAAALSKLTDGGAVVRQQIATAPGAVDGLVRLLISKRDCVRWNAAYALKSTAANSPDSSEVTAVIAEQLVKLISSSKDDECETATAAATLAWLADGNAVLSRQVAATPAAMPRLVQLLGGSRQDVQSAAVSALSKLVAFDFPRSHVGLCQQVAAMPGAAQSLVKLLGSSSQDVQAAATVTVHKFAAISEEFRLQFAAATGAVQRLVQLQCSEHNMVSHGARAALLLLAANRSSNSAVTALVTAELVQLLEISKHGGCDPAVAAAALSICSAGSDVFKQRVAAAPGAVQGLVQLLCAEKHTTHWKAAYALRSLIASSTPDSTVLAVIAAELVRLLDRCKDGSGSPAAAAAALVLLDGHVVLCQQVAASPAAVQGLVQMLGSSNHQAQAAAAQALQHLAAGGESVKQQVAAVPGAVPGLVQLLGSSSQDVQAAAAAALSKLTAGDEVVKNLMLVGPLQRPVHMLGSSSQDVTAGCKVGQSGTLQCIAEACAQQCIGIRSK
jgi:HEAT repeat protein